MARQPLDRTRERGVAEAMTGYMRLQRHTTANQAVRLFKVRYGSWVRQGSVMARQMGARTRGTHATGGSELCLAGRAGSGLRCTTMDNVQHERTA